MTSIDFIGMFKIILDDRREQTIEFIYTCRENLDKLPVTVIPITMQIQSSSRSVKLNDRRNPKIEIGGHMFPQRLGWK